VHQVPRCSWGCIHLTPVFPARAARHTRREAESEASAPSMARTRSHHGRGPHIRLSRFTCLAGERWPRTPALPGGMSKQEPGKRERQRTPDNRTTTGLRISDELWAVREPLLPVHDEHRSVGGGRPRVPERTCADRWEKKPHNAPRVLAFRVRLDRVSGGRTIRSGWKTHNSAQLGAVARGRQNQKVDPSPGRLSRPT
jgi:hypothetical protein